METSMAVEAPLSRYKKNNLLIIAAVLVGFGLWFYYDGYISESFQQKHTNPDGTPSSTLVFNRKAPPFFIGAGIAALGYFFVIRNKKVTADDEKLVAGNTVVPFADVEKVNKTHFDTKGFFTITYAQGGQSKELTLSDRRYDNLAAVLDHVVLKISEV